MKPLTRFYDDLKDDFNYRLNYIKQSVDPIRAAHKPGENYRLKIVCLDVNHGDATLIFLPSGRVALVDSAKDAWAKRRVIPFLRNHQIGEVSYYINTHYHEDHIGMRNTIIRDFLVKTVWDYKSFDSGTQFDLEGVHFTVLNSFSDAEDENDRSLAFRIDYGGFSYTHGADLYADGQRRISKRFPEMVPTDVYRANHHLHGSFDSNYLFSADPELIVISAQEAVYRRVAYTRDFARAVKRLRREDGRLRDVYLTLEKGNVVIFVSDADDWGYSCYAPNIVLDGLYP